MDLIRKRTLEVEKDMVARALREHGGNILKAAESVGKSRGAFDHLIRKHGLTRLVAALKYEAATGETVPEV